MNCPKCSAEFKTISFNDIEVDRCTGCKGLWFDVLKKDDLLKIKGSESIDIGDKQVGESYRDMRKIQCPKCSRLCYPWSTKTSFI